jgi:alpha-tubulin suppressor-like RCC1 family protein
VDGTLYKASSPYNSFVLVPLEGRIIEITSSFYNPTMLIKKADGTVWGMGNNNKGQLGLNPNHLERMDQFVRIEYLAPLIKSEEASRYLSCLNCNKKAQFKTTIASVTQYFCHSSCLVK